MESGSIVSIQKSRILTLAFRMIFYLYPPLSHSANVSDVEKSFHHTFRKYMGNKLSHFKKLDERERQQARAAFVVGIVPQLKAELAKLYPPSVKASSTVHPNVLRCK